MDTHLSADALALLRHRLVTKDNPVDDSNREACRELARAGIMYPVSEFVSGSEASFRFTNEGWARFRLDGGNGGGRQL